MIILYLFAVFIIITFGYYLIEIYKTNRLLKLSNKLLQLNDKLDEVTKETKTVDIDQNLSLRLTDGGRRSLVVMFAWLGSKEKHLNTYKKLYLNKGYDVLTIR